ncbi:hypothetical protein Hamer_G026158 [Homarus americanus]|uniref:Uncharacterized protein n=1 Tax=Homarus americanus TaxID=6706 RepID=A0A8J5JKH8_HOMAM|nr:hypothetical protein Hamer_G026158 [Homarus americanus]
MKGRSPLTERCCTVAQLPEYLIFSIASINTLSSGLPWLEICGGERCAPRSHAGQGWCWGGCSQRLGAMLGRDGAGGAQRLGDMLGGMVLGWGVLSAQEAMLGGMVLGDKELINDMIVPLLHQWTKANALFKPPVINQCRTIELKLTKLWHKAVETSLGKRENNSHIDCGCPRDKKFPVLELEFIKAQRTKAEGQGSMQMGSIDYSETKKQIANAKKREQIREREQKKKMKSEEAIQREEELCQDVYHFFDSSSDEQEATSDDIPPINVNATKLSELVDLSLEVLEPPLTTSLTSQELRNLKETPMQVPKWPSHTQSVERCVKMVTEAAGHVYSHERREGTHV